MADNTDQTARDAATKAQNSIENHLNECSLRYQAVEKAFQAGSKRMEDLKRGQERIFGIIIVGGVGTITTLFGAVWFLAVTLLSAIAETNGIKLP